MATSRKFINTSNPFDFILFKEDDSFVVVGETEPTEEEILKMFHGESVEGWAAE